MSELFENTRRSASFSPDKKFRFDLWRCWDENKPTTMVIGLNPSTANAEKDDNTIRILMQVLSLLGYGSLSMVNCFPVISSKPEILKNEDIDMGENVDNQYNIGDLAENCAVVIFAWGTFDIVKEKGLDKRWTKMFPNAKCFGKNGHCSGMPLKKYVEDYRKQADGYRWNNRDILAYSLTNTVEEIESEERGYDYEESEDHGTRFD